MTTAPVPAARPAPSQFEMVRSQLEGDLRPKLEMLLPKSMAPDRFLAVIVGACKTNPKLLECDRASLFLAIRQAAELGLEPNTSLGHAYLIPFKGRVVLVPGYKGFIWKAADSAGVQIWARLVYAGDTFEFEQGTNEHIRHVPDLDNDNPKDEDIRYVYAVAKSPDGTQKFEIMTKAQVDKIRAAAPGRDAQGWTEHYPEMARKTVVRRLMKYIPISSASWAKLLDLEDEASAPTPLVKSSRPMGPPQEQLPLGEPQREPGED